MRFESIERERFHLYSYSFLSKKKRLWRRLMRNDRLWLMLRCFVVLQMFVWVVFGDKIDHKVHSKYSGCDSESW